MGWAEDLQECLQDIAEAIALQVASGGGPGGIEVLPGSSDSTAYCFSIVWQNDVSCQVCLPLDEIVPSDYCEETMCTCASELAGITAAIENLAVVTTESIGILTSTVDDVNASLVDIKESLDVGNVNTGYLINLGSLSSIATSAGSLPGIATGVGLIAAAQGTIAVEEAAQTVEMAAQTIAQGAIGAGVAALEAPIGAVATQVNDVETQLGLIRIELNPISDIRDTLIFIEEDLTDIEETFSAVEDILNEIKDCVCEGGGASGERFFVKATATTIGPTSSYAGGGGIDRHFPLFGVSFQPKDTGVGDASTRKGEIVWCSYEKSLVQFPVGGPDHWDAVAVPSPAVDAGDITIEIVEIPT